MNSSALEQQAKRNPKTSSFDDSLFSIALNTALSLEQLNEGFPQLGLDLSNSASFRAMISKLPSNFRIDQFPYQGDEDDGEFDDQFDASVLASRIFMAGLVYGKLFPNTVEDMLTPTGRQ